MPGGKYMNSSHTTSSTTWKIDRIKWDVCRTFTFPVKRNLIKRSINFKHDILNQSRKSKPSPCFEDQKYKVSPYSQYKYSYNLIYMVFLDRVASYFDVFPDFRRWIMIYRRYFKERMTLTHHVSIMCLVCYEISSFC